MNENFRTEIKDSADIQINGLEDYLKCNGIDIDKEDAKSSIEWNTEVEASSYGIKSIIVSVTKVTASINWSASTQEITSSDREKLEATRAMETRHESFEGDLTIDSTKQIDGRNWEIKEEFYFKPDGQIYPANVEIDFNTFTITVT